jgi:hypothetical protein
VSKYFQRITINEHFSGDPLYGENLYWGWSSDPNFCLKVSKDKEITESKDDFRKHLSL